MIENAKKNGLSDHGAARLMNIIAKHPVFEPGWKIPSSRYAGNENTFHPWVQCSPCESTEVKWGMAKVSQ